MGFGFKLDGESDTVTWERAEGSVPLTEQQALVVSLSRMAWAMGQVAEGLNAIAEAIRAQGHHHHH